MTLQFHPAARDELIATVMYYEAARPGLGETFRDAVQVVLDHILAHPDIGAERRRARRLMVAGFPYDIVYRTTESAMEVVAVAHHRRRPGFWSRRA